MLRKQIPSKLAISVPHACSCFPLKSAGDSRAKEEKASEIEIYVKDIKNKTMGIKGIPKRSIRQAHQKMMTHVQGNEGKETHHNTPITESNYELASSPTKEGALRTELFIAENNEMQIEKRLHQVSSITRLKDILEVGSTQYLLISFQEDKVVTDRTKREQRIDCPPSQRDREKQRKKTECSEGEYPTSFHSFKGEASRDRIISLLKQAHQSSIGLLLNCKDASSSKELSEKLTTLLEDRENKSKNKLYQLKIRDTQSIMNDSEAWSILLIDSKFMVPSCRKLKELLKKSSYSRRSITITE